MATILNFRRNDQRKPRPLPSGHNAEVVFFTGVRYERAAKADRIVRKDAPLLQATPLPV